MKTWSWLLSGILTFGVLPSMAQESGSDKLDLKKLEDSYWAAKDADYSVVQNRAYPKAQRFFLSASYGPLVNDAYSFGRMTNFAFGYFFSERYGVEFASESGALNDNEGVSQYRAQYGAQVDYNKFKSYNSLNFIFVPLYAKMSFLDRAILYFDMQFALGLGQLEYEIQRDTGGVSEKATAFNFDVTQQLFFHQHIAFRLDIKNKWSSQKRQKYRTNLTEQLSDIQNQDTTLLLGITYFH